MSKPAGTTQENSGEQPVVFPPIVDTSDLPKIMERGYLRIIVPRRSEQTLQQHGLPLEVDRQQAQAFAQKLGLKAQIIEAESRSNLLTLLVEGKGDLIAAQLTATAKRKALVAFTQPTDEVSEWIVTSKQKAPNWAPVTFEELKANSPSIQERLSALAVGRVHLRPSSSYAETVKALIESREWSATIEPVSESQDTEQIVYDVSINKYDYTAVDSQLLEMIESYNSDIQRYVEIAKGRQLAWAIRKTNPKLRAAADSFISEDRLTGHTKQQLVGDLKEIKQSGVLRVLTRNNPVTYFLYRGVQMGFEFELAQMLAKELGVRLEMVVPPDRALLIPWLLEGKGDIIAASMTITPARAKEILFSRPYLYTKEMVIQNAQTGPSLQRLEDLKGKDIHIRPSSSYQTTLESLQEQFGPFKLIPVDETVETTDLIDQVIASQIAFTVADQHIIDVEKTYGKDFKTPFALPSAVQKRTDGGILLETEDKHIAFGMRPQNKQLEQFVNRFVKKTYRGLEYNMAKNKYFKNKRHAKKAIASNASVTGQISPYDATIKKYASKYSLDWRLLSAQAFQESRFNPLAKSWVGARGLFQVMPATGAEMGFTKLENPEVGTHAGVKYMRRMVDRFDPSLPYRQRIRFALASYNAGYGHVMDARRLAAKRGWDPDRWFGNVEKAMILLEQPRYYRKARYGYCRGSEPVQYVSNIQLLYDNYVKLFPQ